MSSSDSASVAPAPSESPSVAPTPSDWGVDGNHSPLLVLQLVQQQVQQIQVQIAGMANMQNEMRQHTNEHAVQQLQHFQHLQMEHSQAQQHQAEQLALVWRDQARMQQEQLRLQQEQLRLQQDQFHLQMAAVPSMGQVPQPVPTVSDRPSAVTRRPGQRERRRMRLSVGNASAELLVSPTISTAEQSLPVADHSPSSTWDEAVWVEPAVIPRRQSLNTSQRSSQAQNMGPDSFGDEDASRSPVELQHEAVASPMTAVEDRARAGHGETIEMPDYSAEVHSEVALSLVVSSSLAAAEDVLSAPSETQDEEAGASVSPNAAIEDDTLAGYGDAVEVQDHSAELHSEVVFNPAVSAVFVAAEGMPADIMSTLRGDIGNFGDHLGSTGVEFLHLSELALAQVDREAVRLVLKKLKAPQSLGFQSLPSVKLLTPSDCAVLVSELDCKCGDELDFKITLTRGQLALRLGPSRVAELEALFPGNFDEIKLRRCAAHGKCINFHLDYSQCTMQIPLNEPSDYIGGRLVFATMDGNLTVPLRPPGSATIHDCTVVHGVTRLISGVRYGLFLLRSG